MQKQAKLYASGGMLMPAARPGVTGFTARITGSSVTPGTIVQYGSSTSEPLLDETVAVGDGTPALTFALPSAKATFGIGSINFIYNGTGTLAEDGLGLFVEAGYMVKARIFVPDGGMLAGSPLMCDYAGTPGRLIPALTDGSTAGQVQKVVGYTAVNIPDPGAAAAEEVHWIYFGTL